MRCYHTAAVARKIASRIYARPARFSWSAGVVSFKSSIAVGGRILEGYGVRSTYYVSMNLAGTERIVGRMFDHEDVCAAHAAGHEIACHTYTHLDCCASPKTIDPRRDRRQHRRALFRASSLSDWGLA
jgi:hypothetical protein